MAEIDRLTVVWDANFQKLDEKLNKVIRANYGAADKISKKWDQTTTGLNRFFGKTDPGKALDKVFDSTRFKILDTGVARVGLFGSALESLGAVGIGAAVGVGAVALAASQLHKAMDFADEIGDTAAKLQVSTKTLQEYRYAVHAAGGETADADAAFASFQETLGRAEAGMPKALKWFKALGFTQEQLRSFKSTDDAIQAVMDRIGKLPDASQRAAAAAAVGLTGMIPAISEGSAKFDELRASAERLGYVLDSDTINKLGDAKDKMEDMSVVVKAQLATALVDLAPVILKVSESIADMARSIAEALDKIRDLRAEVQKQFRSQSPQTRDLYRKVLKMYPEGIGQGMIDFYGLEENAPTIGAPTPGRPHTKLGGGTDLTLPGKDNSAAEARKALERQKASAAAIDAAEKDELAARAALTDSISEQLKFRLDEIEAERQHKNDELDYQAKLKTITQAAADQAKLLNDKAAVEKADLANREAALKLDEADLKQRQDVDKYYAEIAGIAASMARTIKERYAIELKNLEHVQGLERDQLKHDLDAQVAAGSLSQSGADEQLAAQADAQAAQRKKLEYDNLEPFAAWVDTLPKSIDEVNEKMQSLAVDGIEGLNNAIVDLATGTGKATDILRNFLQQMLADFTKLELQQVEGSLANGGGPSWLRQGLSFAASLFGGPSGASLSASAASLNATNATLVAAGLADGGHITGPGGPRGDKIPIWASDGEFMVNAEATKKHRALLEAINGGRPLPRYANGGIVNLTSLRLGGGSSAPAVAANWSPTLHVYVQAAPGMTGADARRTGGQIASAAMERMAQARRRGL